VHQPPSGPRVGLAPVVPPGVVMLNPRTGVIIKNLGVSLVGAEPESKPTGSCGAILACYPTTTRCLEDAAQLSDLVSYLGK
jgi:hypothetical protein